MATHRPCGRTWTGLHMEHCAAAGCCQTFSGPTTGDAHRVGKYPDRRCLTPDEMTARGWHKDRRGIWRGKPRAVPA